MAQLSETMMLSLSWPTVSNYMITYNIFPAFNVRNDELLEMSRKLRNADENKALPGQIMLNFQGHTNTRDSSDSASGTWAID